MLRRAGWFFLLLAGPAYPQSECDVLAKLHEPDPEFEKLELKFEQKTYKYHEIRYGRRREYRKPVQEIGLRILNLETCRTEIVKIIQRGNIPESPYGWHVQVEARINGVQWNLYNSQYDIVEPQGMVLLENKVLRLKEKRISRTIKSKSGKKVKIYESIWTSDGYYIYSPYTRAIHTVLTVDAGDRYERQLIESVFDELRKRKVRSKAFPDELVSDVHNPEWFYRLRLTEHMDYSEFGINDEWRQWSAERVLVIIGLNRERAGTYVCNYAGACGPMQFTDRWRTVKSGKSRRRLPGTYSTVVMAYPAAKLIKKFEDGAKDDFNSMMAAVLLHDLNLLSLIGRYGPDIRNSPHIEGVLGARYNASPLACQLAADAAFIRKDPGWARRLKYRETREYIEKMEFLKTFTPNGGKLPPEMDE